jgi:hypothetical protein
MARLVYFNKLENKMTKNTDLSALIASDMDKNLSDNADLFKTASEAPVATETPVAVVEAPAALETEASSVNFIVNSLLKVSEVLDNAGLSKTAELSLALIEQIVVEAKAKAKAKKDKKDEKKFDKNQFKKVDKKDEKKSDKDDAKKSDKKDEKAAKKSDKKDEKKK